MRHAGKGRVSAHGREAGLARASGSMPAGSPSVWSSLAAPPAARLAIDRWLTVFKADRLGVGLALAAWLAWIGSHLPGRTAIAIVPEWVILGLAVGLLRPWLGLLLTIAVVPFLGGSVDQAPGEILRVVPIFGAAGRVLFDRLAGHRSTTDPPVWVTVAAVLAALLYVGTMATFMVVFNIGLAGMPTAGWVVGGPAAGMAAWVVASHVAPRRQAALADMILVVTVVAATVALLAWAGAGFVSPFVFPAAVRERLSALGYPTPTGMGLAIALPAAFAAAWRRSPFVAVGMAVPVVVAIVLTESRGPLLALGAGVVVAVLVWPRLSWRLAAALVAAGALVAAAYLVVNFGTSPAAILNGLAEKAGGDSARIASWGAGLAMAIRSPLVGGGWHALSQVPDYPGLDSGTVQSHNVFLNAFSEGGLPLGIAHGAVILFSLLMAWRRRRLREPYVLATVVVYVVCGLWDMPQTRAYGAVMGGLAMGLAAAGIPGPEAEPAAPRRDRPAERRALQQRRRSTSS